MDSKDIQYINEGFPLAIVDNYYTPEELSLVWEELDFLTYKDKLDPPDLTGTAQIDGKNAKQNSGLFLDSLYAKRELSNIMTVNSESIMRNWNEIMVASHNEKDWFFREISREWLKSNTMLMSYYEDEDYYETHKDAAVITVLHWLYREPKRFKGGDLIFPDYKDDNGNPMGVEVVNNRTILFPSCISHQVIPIIMEEKYKNQKLGRYCITQFLHYRQLD